MIDMANMPKGALHGIKVLDLSRVLAGPSCTQVLADLGAEVIKVERPHIGDETRHWAPPTFSDDTSAYYATINRNKKSLTVDITTPTGQTIIKQLIADSDILVENFKVGGLKKYGLDYDSLKQDNPRLIYASLTGFGQTGPDAARPGYDYIIQGLSGLMSITGPSDGEPHKVGVAVVDLFAGLQLTIGIQAALLARQNTGLGQHVDVALLDSALAMLANVGMNHLASDKIPPRLGNQHPNIVPYQVFAGEGEQHFILACGNDSQFAKLCDVLAVDWHTDEHFATNPQRVANRELLCGELTKHFAKQSRTYWLEVLDQAGIPCGAIHNVAEALAMPQAQAREMIVNFTEQGSPVRALGNPIKLSASPVTYRTPPPKLSEHTDSTLADLGYDSEMIAKLKADGIV
ncbi:MULTISPECIES: CaiB/BaiF CoA-transferase family protein [unclassified Psychrobacter]|uniref:CaiB/BaiF CoA transferase family protein n=1 Tax=unclassified Psychrobacter TaxID=196806 RepID=UPI000C7DBB34|nr:MULTISPECIES: CaiB/BaiF CoA-transferase family protein [unclassified Psychrobacter]PKG67071.1 CoA transferase [Psychrobacter sp. Choline-02u-13]PKH55383.1 CoA transferase [Psychrobacter sp. Choline-02u-9]TEW88139.1 CoA transferase [Psychrobacter sp. 230]